MRAGLVTDALAAAIRTRGSLAGSIMHTDHGAQYTSRTFAQACRSAGVRQSMSAVGSSSDNALAESFNATFKRETLQGRKSWPTEREARLDAFRWLHRYLIASFGHSGSQAPQLMQSSVILTAIAARSCLLVQSGGQRANSRAVPRGAAGRLTGVRENTHGGSASPFGRRRLLRLGGGVGPPLCQVAQVPARSRPGDQSGAGRVRRAVCGPPDCGVPDQGRTYEGSRRGGQ